MNKKRMKPGPKPIPKQLRRSMVLQLRLSHEEHGTLKALADKRGISMADLLMEPYRKG
jgi:hypothetical protein